MHLLHHAHPSIYGALIAATVQVASSLPSPLLSDFVRPSASGSGIDQSTTVNATNTNGTTSLGTAAMTTFESEISTGNAFFKQRYPEGQLTYITVRLNEERSAEPTEANPPPISRIRMGYESATYRWWVTRDENDDSQWKISDWFWPMGWTKREQGLDGLHPFDLEPLSRRLTLERAWQLANSQGYVDEFQVAKISRREDDAALPRYVFIKNIEPHDWKACKVEASTSEVECQSGSYSDDHPFPPRRDQVDAVGAGNSTTRA